ncbi:MAG: hypothetical protein LBD15_02150 [Holosporales bacterium]|nr:hypothetical protein [Holosporales bacterium]
MFGPRLAVVARELTKKFEEVRRQTLDHLVAHYSKTTPKGEIVLLITGVCDVYDTCVDCDACDTGEKEGSREILERHLACCSVKEAVRLTHQ